MEPFTKGKAMTDWHDELERMLLSAGIKGVPQQEFVKLLKNKAKGAEIEAYLEALWSEKKVQRFTMPVSSRGGRAMRVWRATKS